MALYFLQPSIFDHFYNCTAYQVEDVPFGQRQKIVLGTISIILFFIFQPLYILCVLAIWRSHMDQSCYKIMFVLGLVDIFALFICGLLTGIFGLFGIVYCSSPRMIYFLGTIGDMCYYFETSAATLLAADRCLRMASQNISDSLFNGHKTWIWLLLIFAYVLSAALWLNRPVLFNSITYTWFYNPHQGYLVNVGDQYGGIFHWAHDAAIIILMVVFYTIFLVTLFTKHQVTTPELNSAVQAMRRTIFLQVFLLSMLNLIIATCYAAMTFIDSPPITDIIFGTYAWEFLHGFPALIYLGLNKTLRHECMKIVKYYVNKIADPSQISQQIIHLQNPARVGAANNSDAIIH